MARLRDKYDIEAISALAVAGGCLMGFWIGAGYLVWRMLP